MKRRFQASNSLKIDSEILGGGNLSNTKENHVLPGIASF